MKTFYGLLAIFLLGVATACTNTVFSTADSLPATVASATSAPLFSATPKISSSASATPEPTRTAFSKTTSTPQPSTTVTPYPVLSVREPSISQIDAFVQSFYPDFYGLTTDIPLAREDVSGDGVPDQVARATENWRSGQIVLALVYQDVSGDGEADLITWGDHGLVVILWEQTHYAKPYLIIPGWSRGNAPEISVTLEDLTTDHIPEIVYDEGLMTGGTGLWIWYVNRTLLSCRGGACNVAWGATLSTDTTDYNTGGIASSRADIRSVTDSLGRSEMRVLRAGYSVYSVDWWLDTPPDHPVDSVYVLTTTLETYTWNGQVFVPNQPQIVERARIVEWPNQLTAVGQAGIKAEVVWQDNYAAGNANEYCQLILDGKKAGKEFGCRHKLTRVEWKTLAGREVLSILTYSAGYPLNRDGDQLADEDCMHQRIVAYEWRDNQAIEVANIAGCVEQADLWGVRWEDYDKDGIDEIVAAHTVLYSAPDLPKRVYKWNGEKFVMWSELP